MTKIAAQEPALDLLHSLGREVPGSLNLQQPRAIPAPQRASGRLREEVPQIRPSCDTAAAHISRAESWAGARPLLSALNRLPSPHCTPPPPHQSQRPRAPRGPCPWVPTCCCFMSYQFPSDGNTCPVTGDRRYLPKMQTFEPWEWGESSY